MKVAKCDRAQAIVLLPELEAWVWRDSRHLEAVMGWKTRPPAFIAGEGQTAGWRRAEQSLNGPKKPSKRYCV